MGNEGERPQLDVLVVGAGMAGLHLLHELRASGFSAVAIDVADDVGGTWYWNRYPGARCDIQSLDYQFTFDPDLEAEWEWTEKYATQPEILRYLQHVADRHDLRRDIRFGTRLDRAEWDEAADCWRVTTSTVGDGATSTEATARHVVMATGCLSVPKQPDIPGTERFSGDVHVTGRWPHDGVDFTGRRVAVIGTGSSGIQSIPLIAEQADQLTVFQRTPNYSMPAGNGPIPRDKARALADDPAAYHEAARWTQAGVVMPIPTERVADVSPEERTTRFEEAWQRGELLAPGSTFTDLLISETANEEFAEFVRGKIRSIVDDPATAEALCPYDHPFGTKRPCLDTSYFETYNLRHVRLVDLRRTPIESITETGIDVGGDRPESMEFDAIVYATGFDAMTGAIVAVDIRGREGIQLRERWADGPLTYLGLTSVGFPNLFMITGPGSPSVLSNMVVSIEQHVDLVTDILERLRDEGFDTIEPTPAAEAGWMQHVHDCADITLLPKATSWYMGANVPGKPRVVLPYVGGVDRYRRACDEVVERDLLGFRRTGPGGERVVDGVVRRLQPDVAIMLDLIAEANLPPFESLPVPDARMMYDSVAEMRRPGPDVGEIVDATLPGAAGDLDYRLYRPASEGPHAIVCYFHGGGWVFGSSTADDPFCREMCALSDAIVVSVDYRHAPEHPFPAAVDDAVAALGWIATNAASLGGRADRIVVAGWSAGGNLAAVAARRARDGGAPDVCGQLLVAPVTDGSRAHPSIDENADGYGLTKPVMTWFWDHYADADQRTSPDASPLLARDLSGLPPAAVFTAEFDPLRDEGIAYAEALRSAGVDVEHHAGRGQTHTSLTATDMLISSIPIRAEMAASIRGFVAPADDRPGSTIARPDEPEPVAGR